MNIESATLSPSKSSDVASASSSSSSNTGNISNDTNSTSFKDELAAVKNSDTKETKEAKEANQTQDAQNNGTVKENQNATSNIKDSQKTAEESELQKISISKLLESNKNSKNVENNDELATLNELNTKIATMNEIKNNSKTQAITSKTGETTDKSDNSQSMKMNNNDITFFLNLVQNQQMTAQNVQGNNQLNNNSITNFNEIKTNATQSSVQVSQTLLDALSDASKTGKSLRIDFGSDVAVIMKVDKQGVISANFIPGSAAVENYLKNNIESLRQNFDNQNLPYNQLSYSNQQQKQSKQQNNKENEKDE